MPQKKGRYLTKKEFEKITIDEFNDGRIEADRKWIQAIDERIRELEEKVGIPELRKLKKAEMYRWR